MDKTRGNSRDVNADWTVKRAPVKEALWGRLGLTRRLSLLVCVSLASVIAASAYFSARPIRAELPAGPGDRHNARPVTAEDDPPQIVDADYHYDMLKITITVTGKLVDDGSVFDREISITGAVTGSTFTEADGTFCADFPYPTLFPAIIEIVGEDEVGQQSAPVVLEVK